MPSSALKRHQSVLSLPLPPSFFWLGAMQKNAALLERGRGREGKERLQRAKGCPPGAAGQADPYGTRVGRNAVQTFDPGSGNGPWNGTAWPYQVAGDSAAWKRRRFWLQPGGRVLLGSHAAFPAEVALRGDLDPLTSPSNPEELFASAVEGGGDLNRNVGRL